MTDNSLKNNKDLSKQEIETYFNQLEIGNWKTVLEALDILAPDYSNSPSFFLITGIAHSMAMLENGDIEKPIVYFDKAKSLGCGLKDYYTNLKEHYSRIGHYLYSIGDNEDSYKYFIKATEYSSNNNHIYLTSAANMLVKLNKAEEAKAMYKKAIKIDNNYVFAYNNLGLCCYTHKDYNEALINFHKCILVDDTNPIFWVNYANCLWALKRQEEALEAYYKVRMLDPSNPDTFILLASALDTMGQDSELQEIVSTNLDNFAVNSADKELKIKSEKISFLLNILGNSYFKTKDFQKSIDSLNMALEIAPDNICLHNDIIKAYNKVGDHKKIKTHTEKISKLSNKDKDND